MVAQEPGESEADYELRRRDYRQSRSRCILSSTSEEEEEKKEKKEKREKREEEAQAASSAAGSGLGAVDSTAPEGEEKVEEKEEKREIRKGAPKTKETRGKGPLPGTRSSSRPSADPPRPPRNFLRVETKRRAVSPRGTSRPAATLTSGELPAARNRDQSQTYQVRGLRGREGLGPDPSERLELSARPPSESPVPDAPWRKPAGGDLKRAYGPGFRLRSQQSRQYRVLKDQLRLARKTGHVSQNLKDQVEDFGRGRPKTMWRKRKRESSESRRPIRLRSVARPNPSSSSKAKAKPKARSSARPLARSFVRGTPQTGLKVHGRALKLNKKIRDLAERWVGDNPTVPYFLESPYQVRHLAANQLKRETGVKGAVAASLVQNLWNSPNVGSTAQGPDEACSSCDDRRVDLEPGVAEYLKRRAEAKISSTAKQ